MIINTTAGKTYAVTPQTDCTVSTTDGVLIASCAAGEQTLFVAPGAEVEVSEDSALVTESFKGAPAGLSAVWSSIKKVSASLASKLNVSTFNAHQANTTVHVTAQEREKWNGKQDNLTDESGNMTLAGGLTAAGAINANGGVNIPLAVGAPTNESGVNRLYASGLAAVTEAFSPQSFLSDFNLYGAAATVEQTVPGWCFRLKQTAKGSCTIKVHFLNPFLGVSNYSGWCGFVLPLAAGNTGSTVARKISFSIGKRGSVVEKTAESLDMFTLSPAPGSTESFPRFVDVTFYLQSDASSSPAGYPVRVRELMYDTAARKWVVHETQSVIPSFNTNPSATMFLACVQNRVAISGAEAGLWIGSNAYDTRRLLCIADLHALQDSFDFTGVDRVYWDSSGINAFSFIGAMRQLTVPGYNQPNGSYAAFRALETRLIQSTSTYEFTPYE